MISNLKQTKYYFEKLFADIWVDTPIHFVGQEYDATGVDTWINPRFVPSRGSLAALSGKRTRLEASLDVICWAKNDVEAFGLADKIVDFVVTNATSFAISNFEINDHGWDDSNMVYLYLTFNVEYYEGECQAPIAPIVPVGIVNNGIMVVNNGVPVINT